MKILKSIKKGARLLGQTTSEFIDDGGLKLSAALSYYTVFSLPPLLIIIISVCGVFFGREAINGEIFGQINGLVGNDAATQIQEIIKNVHLSTSNVFATIFGVSMLLIGASGVFAEIQDSINFIWGLKAKPKRGFVKFLINRLMSFSMIGTVGFLLMVGLIINTLMELLNKRLLNVLPEFTVYFFYVINLLIVFFIIALLFSVIFKTLPDGVVAWKDAFVGAGFTSFLFMIGKFAIGAYLGTSKIATVYGAAGSIILILVWVYYSAIILYFGAEFTKIYAHMHGEKIIPKDYAVYIKKNLPDIEPKITEGDLHNLSEHKKI
jgi:membrane protein